MALYKIFTETTCDFTGEMIDELDINVLPLGYILEGVTYKKLDETSEDKRDFYDKLRSGSMPTTTQINSEEFIEAFEPVLKAGEDILYIAFSSGLSGTYQSANIAKDELQEKYPDRRIVIFDSLCASLGEGLFVYHAARLRLAGATMDAVIQWLNTNVLKICHWFTVDDLNHLKRGGRVSPAVAFVGTMLGIKPVLHVDDEGHLTAVSKVRGRKKSLDALVDKMEESAINPAEQVVFISHGDCLEDAQYVADQVKNRFGVKKVYINYVGPVIGSHSGPGTLALFFIGNSR